ncbi:hypothetical protein [Arthrobacter sp. UM1]|uniref:hypothetical protein n=1 Tax=Arthrobacter sp. UM1 TaxID=2766776 RepID=UPI001CF64971|nr:hypothetical protein [Arthrobacter sp. UM1]MCB4208591.1 hypothetical protein [Arthrobacter sp. UM1]
MAHLGEPASDFPTPGELRLTREFDPRQTPILQGITPRIALKLTVFLISEAFGKYLPGIWRGTRISTKALIAVTSVFVLLSVPVAFGTKSWIPLLIALVLFPALRAALAVLTATALLLAGLVPLVQWQWKPRALTLPPGTVRMDVYDRALVLSQKGTRCLWSGVTRVRRGSRDRTLLKIRDEVPLLFPASLLAVTDIEHLEGGPAPVLWPSDGGPEALKTPAWGQAQAESMPDDEIGRLLAESLGRSFEGPSPKRWAREPSAARYDPARSVLCGIRDRTRIDIERGTTLLGRRSVVRISSPHSDMNWMLNVGEFVPEDLRRLARDLGPHRCNLDIELEGERFVFGDNLPSLPPYSDYEGGRPPSPARTHLDAMRDLRARRWKF